jgi:hypothetical protein
VDAAQYFAVGCSKLEPLAALGQRSGRRDRVGRKDQLRLEFDHCGNQCGHNQGRRKQSEGANRLRGKCRVDGRG